MPRNAGQTLSIKHSSKINKHEEARIILPEKDGATQMALAIKLIGKNKIINQLGEAHAKTLRGLVPCIEHYAILEVFRKTIIMIPSMPSDVVFDSFYECDT